MPLIRGSTRRCPYLVLQKIRSQKNISSQIILAFNGGRPSFFSATTSSPSKNKPNTTEIKNPTQQASKHLALAAVIRYDHNCATIPYVGSYDEASSLKERMEANTHKHHIFLVEGDFRREVPLGPYPSLDAARKALGYCVGEENEEKWIMKIGEYEDRKKKKVHSP